MQVDSCRVDHRIRRPCTTGSEAPGRDSERQRILPGQHAVGLCLHNVGLVRRRQGGIGVAVLCRHELAPDIHRTAVLERCLDVGIGLTDRGEHLAREGDRELDDVIGAAAGKHLDRLAHLVGVADREPQRRFHAGEQCRGRDAGVGSERDHRLSELASTRLFAHEGAGAELHIEGQRARALCDLLRHDRRCDQRNRLDRARHVAQRVQPLVGRSEALARGADDTAEALELLHDLVVRQVGTPAGNRLELVEGSAGVTEAAARKLRHRDAERGNQRHERQRDLVADAARRVLVDGRLRQLREVHALTRPDHGLRHVEDLAALHAVQEDRHDQRCHLRIVDVLPRVGIDEPVDLLGAQGTAVSLRADDVDGVECFNHQESFR